MGATEQAALTASVSQPYPALKRLSSCCDCAPGPRRFSPRLGQRAEKPRSRSGGPLQHAAGCVLKCEAWRRTSWLVCLPALVVHGSLVVHWLLRGSAASKLALHVKSTGCKLVTCKEGARLYRTRQHFQLVELSAHLRTSLGHLSPGAWLHMKRQGGLSVACTVAQRSFTRVRAKRRALYTCGEVTVEACGKLGRGWSSTSLDAEASPDEPPGKADKLAHAPNGLAELATFAPVWRNGVRLCAGKGAKLLFVVRRFKSSAMARAQRAQRSVDVESSLRPRGGAVEGRERLGEPCTSPSQTAWRDRLFSCALFRP